MKSQLGKKSHKSHADTFQVFSERMKEKILEDERAMAPEDKDQDKSYLTSRWYAYVRRTTFYISISVKYRETQPMDCR